tara:strand:- start:278 stop:541 length:264 start_codon:yes stop_codon:yes gene_type:complete
MTEEEKNKKYNAVMERVKSGNFKVHPHFPKDVQIAVQSFLSATKMMVEEDLPYIPTQYLENLLTTLSKYPEYNKITLDLCEAFNTEL